MWGVALESLDNGAHFWFLTGSFKGNKSQSLHLREQRRERELAWDATWTLLGSTGGEVFPEVRKGSLCSLASPDCALNLPSQWPWLSNSSLSVPSFPVCTIYTRASRWPAAVVRARGFIHPSFASYPYVDMGFLGDLHEPS